MMSVCIIGFLVSCDAVKRVAEDKYLLTDNTVVVNDKKDNTETINSLLYQKPNRKILGIPLRLHIYNTARNNIDSIVDASINKTEKRKNKYEKFLSKKQLKRYKSSRIGFNEWLKTTGEAPVVLSNEKIKKSVNRLKDYYIYNGWSNVNVDYEIDHKENKRASVDYIVNHGEPYIIDTISKKIESPTVEILHNQIERNALIKPGDQYKIANLGLERDRISNELRNLGLFHFNQDYITFAVDTVETEKKANIDLIIKDRTVETDHGNRVTRPFKVQKIKNVEIYTDYKFENEGQTPQDTIYFNNYTLYSYNKMRYRPKALTDAIFITPDSIFRDIDRTLTYRHLNELQTFKYPDIEYDTIPNSDTELSATIKLTPLKKFSLGFSAEALQSNIQSVGFSFNPSLLIRNIFKGAETFQISAIGSLGSSKDKNNADDPFLDINEIGVDLKLNIPRLFSPFNTERIVPKHMSPSTIIGLSTTSQTNIGLDKQTFTGTFTYNWNPNDKITNRLDLFNVQYVRNLNIGNYFDVYQNSYNTLNSISESINYNNGNPLAFPDQTDAFLSDVLGNNTSLMPEDNDYKTVSAINERKDRLTENNLIFSSNFSFIKDGRNNLFDEDFSIFRFKLELAGNLLANTSKLFGLKKNTDNRYEIFNVAFSQYIKTEFDYIKHWNLGKKNVLAMRTFFGIALPYGNSDNIPFAKSFFAGGSNDNRAWTAYSLGPGSSESINEFNEANLKLALSVEQRFNIFESLNGAVFVDAGNIWNVLDDVEDDNATFTDFNSLKDIAIGSGFGLRYDFSFFVLRFDIGFKTYDPSYKDQNRWFNDFNFRNAVYNIGINYPF